MHTECYVLHHTEQNKRIFCWNNRTLTQWNNLVLMVLLVNCFSAIHVLLQEKGVCLSAELSDSIIALLSESDALKALISCFKVLLNISLVESYNVP